MNLHHSTSHPASIHCFLCLSLLTHLSPLSSLFCVISYSPLTRQPSNLQSSTAVEGTWSMNSTKLQWRLQKNTTGCSTRSEIMSTPTTGSPDMEVKVVSQEMALLSNILAAYTFIAGTKFSIFQSLSQPNKNIGLRFKVIFVESISQCLRKCYACKFEFQLKQTIKLSRKNILSWAVCIFIWKTKV